MESDSFYDFDDVVIYVMYATYGNTISIDIFTAFLHPERRESWRTTVMEERVREVTACELELSYRPTRRGAPFTRRHRRSLRCRRRRCPL